MADSQVFLAASDLPEALPELYTDLYEFRRGANSLTVTMASHYLFGTMGLGFAGGGLVGVLSGGSGLIGSPANWSASILVLGVGAVFLGVGLWLSRAVIDLRSITIEPGRATVGWQVLRRTIRTLTFDVRLVVVQHDIWAKRNGSTDQVILEGDAQRHCVAALWNIPPIGTFKPPFNNWALGEASGSSPSGESADQRTVSPLILGLAKLVAAAASVPIELRVGTTHGPWVTIGGD